jgi:hypothetical protein
MNKLTLIGLILLILGAAYFLVPLLELYPPYFYLLFRIPRIAWMAITLLGVILLVVGMVRSSRAPAAPVAAAQPASAPSPATAPKASVNAVSTSRFCGECGSALQAGETFCGNCGARS